MPVCLVIGGTGALGRGCAEDLGSTGYQIVIAGRNKAKGDEAVQAIVGKGGDATFIAFDICDQKSIHNLHQEVIKKYGRLDVAINGAGVTGPPAKLHELDPAAVAEVLTINLSGVMYSMQEQIRLMMANPGGSGGRIINFTSIYGLHGVSRGAAYSTTKHALVGLTKSTALEYSNPKDNILINAVAPGLIPSEMTAVFVNPDLLPDGEVKEEIKQTVKLYTMGKFGTVEDVARGVRFLIESPWVTGTVLEIDGGYGAH